VQYCSNSSAWALLSDDEDDFAALVGKIVQDFGDQTSGAFTEIFY